MGMVRTNVWEIEAYLRFITFWEIDEGCQSPGVFVELGIYIYRSAFLLKNQTLDLL